MLRYPALIVATCLLAPAAFADSFYVAGRVGVATVDDVAKTDPVSFGPADEPPAAIPVGGRLFDSSDTAAGLTVGWKAREWLAIELGYTDLGKAEQKRSAPFVGPALISPDPIIVPSPLPPVIRPGPIGGVIAAPFAPGVATLRVEEWSLAARFSARLVSSLSANWSVGVSRAEFESGGQLTLQRIVSTDPLAIESTELSFVSPGSETGFTLGLGFAWSFNERFSADLGYKRHYTQVLDVESVTLQLVLTL